MEFMTTPYDLRSASTDAPTTLPDVLATAVSGNFSLIDEDLDLEDELLFHVILYKVVVPVMFGLIIGVGVIGNALVVYVTLTCRAMRTTVNLLLLNLAASDLLFLVVAVPFITYHFAADNWQIGDVACKLSHFVLYVSVYVTVYTLVAIAVVRFVSVVRSSPLPTPAPRRVGLVVVAVWTAMVAANSPLLAMYRVKVFVVPNTDIEPYYYCALDDHLRHGPPLFVTFFALTYVVPLTVIVTMYLLIVRYLVARRHGMAVQTTRGARAGGARLQSLQSRRASYAWRVFLAVVVVFGVCWLPMHAHLLVAYLGLLPKTRSYAVFRVFCHCLAYSNSCANPFVYHYVSADFRRCLADVAAAAVAGICRRRRRQPGRRRQRRHTLEECTVSQKDGKKTLDQRRY